MSLRTLFLLVLLAPFGSAQSAPAVPLHDGEGLTYRVSWAIVGGAGEIDISARREVSPGVDRLVITSNTATRGLARAFLRFKAEAQSFFDLRTGKLSIMHETSELRGKSSEHMVIFDYEKREAHYTPMRDSKKPATVLPMPPGDPMDLIVALMQTRNWSIKPGEKRDMLVLWDDDFYELTLHAIGYEEVKTPLGTYNTLVLEPRMEKTPPKGMFRRGSTVRVWIAQDAHRLPVKFAVEFKIGTGVATLEAYQPPAQPVLGTAAAPRHGESPRS